MAIRKTTAIRVGVATVGLAAGVTAVYLTVPGLADADQAPAEQQLQCASGQQVGTDVLYGIPETPNGNTAGPREIADRWMDVRAPAREARGVVELSRREVRRGEDLRQFAYIRTDGSPEAILTIVYSKGLGWHLENAVECA